MKIARTLVIVYGAVILGSAILYTSEPADPTFVQIPPRTAHVVGVWQGTWEEVLPSHLLVRDVTADRAGVLYLWEDARLNPAPYGGMRATARVSQGTLEWRGAGEYRFEPSPDGSRLVGTRRLLGNVARVEMRRLDPAPHISLLTLGTMADRED